MHVLDIVWQNVGSDKSLCKPSPSWSGWRESPSDSEWAGDEEIVACNQSCVSPNRRGHKSFNNLEISWPTQRRRWRRWRYFKSTGSPSSSIPVRAFPSPPRPRPPWWFDVPQGWKHWKSPFQCEFRHWGSQVFYSLILGRLLFQELLLFWSENLISKTFASRMWTWIMTMTLISLQYEGCTGATVLV